MGYTVAIREKGKSRRWLYLGDDGHCYDTATRCKPLDRQSATWAKNRLIDLAEEAGRPITCRVVSLNSIGRLLIGSEPIWTSN